MKNSWELHRFFMPILLHADLGHISANLIAQLMIGSNLESDIGSAKFFTLYVLSGLGGNAFSALTTDSLAVGASTAVFGLAGSYIAFIIINIEYLTSRPERFCQILMFIVLSVLLTVMLGGKNVDIMGHLGGFLTGVFCGHWLLPCHEESNARKTRASTLSWWFKIVTAVWFVLVLGFFFTVRDPSEKFNSGTALKVDAAKETPAPTPAPEEKKAEDPTPPPAPKPEEAKA